MIHRSTPGDLWLCLLTTFGVHLPEAVNTLISPMAAANPCIAMLLGVMISLSSSVSI